MLYSVITTIQGPTASVNVLISRLAESGGKLIVAGDSNGPASYAPPSGGRKEMSAVGSRQSSVNSSLNIPHSEFPPGWPVEFLSLPDQENGRFKLAQNLPTKHYARKNIAYLYAIAAGAECIYETDDDNAPNEHWAVRNEEIAGARLIPKSDARWVNVYRHFSNENIWPRGLPLDEIRKPQAESVPMTATKRAPIQQGLVNGSADVDAIWRLVMDREFTFEDAASVYLEPGNWCPFNTQSTWWWPVVYPLLYIPSYCSFRMCDIWKSFVAQRCLWDLDMGVIFHAPEVYQDRNPHDLMRDFRDEIPGYNKNRQICEILGGLRLARGEAQVGNNLLHCYQALVEGEIFPEKELPLVEDWLADLNSFSSVVAK